MADSPTICVTLGRERLHDLLADHRRLVAEGARLVEWRLDWLTEPIDVAELFAKQIASATRVADLTGPTRS